MYLIYILGRIHKLFNEPKKSIVSCK